MVADAQGDRQAISTTECDNLVNAGLHYLGNMPAAPDPSPPAPSTPEWFDQVVEDIIDPDVEIIDPHHHLWRPGGPFGYHVAELVADTTSGHNVVATMFMQCGASHRPDGPEHLRPVGETDFVMEAAAEIAADHPAAPPIAGIVANADLAHPALDEVLDAHLAASDGRVKGIRDALSRADDPALMIPGDAAAGRFEDPAFLAGVRRLGERGMTYDSWHYHWQNAELAAVARACPDTSIVLDHFGTPLGVGAFADRRDEIFEEWKVGLVDAASCDNVTLKVGGMAMPDNGFGWHTAERPPTSDEFVDAQGRYYRFAIETFGPDRCMFESNFPVDRLSLSYPVLWNALKKIAAPYSADERAALFAGTARRVYGI